MEEGRRGGKKKKKESQSGSVASPVRPVGVQQPFTKHKRRNKRRLGAKQLKTLRPIALHRFLSLTAAPTLSFLSSFFSSFLCLSTPRPLYSPSLSLSLSFHLVLSPFFTRWLVARLFNHSYSHRIKSERGQEVVEGGGGGEVGRNVYRYPFLTLSPGFCVAPLSPAKHTKTHTNG